MEITTVETILDNLNIPHTRIPENIIPQPHGWMILIPRSTVSIYYEAKAGKLSVTVNNPELNQHCFQVKSLAELIELMNQFFNK